MESSDPTSHTSLRLCTQCQTLNLEALFTDQHWNAPVAISNPHPGQCHFCIALKFIRPDLLQADKTFRLVQLRHPSKYSRFRITVMMEGDGAVWTPHTRFAKSHSPGSITMEEDLECCEMSLLDETFSSGNANFDLHRRWLQNCRDHHNDSCNVAPDGSLLSNLILIDCETKKIHHFQHGDVYCALSYRWGPREEAPEDQDELSRELPPTIKDAISVTRELGIRYIWIDRYCIPQRGNIEEKARQIANMHRIYHGAEVTIIAAAGDSPQHGLPGVSRKRASPPRLEIGKQKFACTLPDPRLLIESSTWSSRGWTYQEGLLSRRRLVFTDQQSYFQCNHIRGDEYYGNSEAVSWIFTNRLCGKVTGDKVDGFFRFGISHDEIWSRVNEFTSRHLTCENDILNAMLGILETYAETSWDGFSFWHLYGLPVYRMHEWSHIPNSWFITLLLSLSWEKQCPSSRRQNFPSWSWTGWTGSGFIGPYESLYPFMHNDFLFSTILPPAETDDGPETDFDQLIDDESGHPINWNVRFLTVSTPCITGFIRLREHCPPTVLDKQEHPTHNHLLLFNDLGLVFTMKNRERFYSYDFQLQREDLVSDPKLEDGIPCLSLLLDLNKEEARATEDIELHYRKDSQSRVRWGAAAILALKACDENGDFYERVGKVAIPRRHLIGTSEEYKAIRLG